MQPPLTPAAPKAQDALRQLERVLSSPGFARNPRMSRFLRTVVERGLEGRHDELKESLIGIEVFGRRPDFDPKADSIVRTEAARLRARLAEYYADAGRADPIVIELPKGAYVPTFRVRAEAEEPAPPSRAGARWPAGALALLAVVAAASAGWWAPPRDPVPIAIAVLPLESLSRDAANTYFADGLTDEIIRNLSAIEGLAVRSRTSSFAFKGAPRNVREVGRQLDAEYVVEGSVQRDAGQLRINVRLVRTKDDVPVWSERYDRLASDVFAIQDQISRGIVNQLRLSLGRGRWRYETSIEAYDRYLRAREAAAGRGLLGAIESIPALEEVVAIDKAFAPAYAELGAAYAIRSAQFAVDHPPDELDRMRAAARRAIELDPLLADAHAAMALAHSREANWTQADASFRRAVELDPSRSKTREHYAMWYLHVVGRNEEALEQLAAAAHSDPLSADVDLATAWVLLSLGRHDEAAPRCDRLPESHSLKRQCVGRARLGAGRLEEAAGVFAGERNREGSPQTRGFLGYAYARMGRRAEAERMLQTATRANEQALISAGLGDRERTLAALEEMAAVGPQRVGHYLESPEMALVRDDPRLALLRRRVGLP